MCFKSGSASKVDPNKIPIHRSTSVRSELAKAFSSHQLWSYTLPNHT